jgi:hypothetical protein
VVVVVRVPADAELRRDGLRRLVRRICVVPSRNSSPVVPDETFHNIECAVPVPEQTDRVLGARSNLTKLAKGRRGVRTRDLRSEPFRATG